MGDLHPNYDPPAIASSLIFSKNKAQIQFPVSPLFPRVFFFFLSFLDFLSNSNLLQLHLAFNSSVEENPERGFGVLVFWVSSNVTGLCN